MIPSISPYDVLQAGRWHAALLTTFSLSLSFFEAVALQALRKAGTRDIGILADMVGYESSLSEAGVSDVGRTYDLLPLRVAKGCFHPKLMILDGPDGVRATVGSGNLTFGGWGHNIETLDLLVPAQAPKAYADLAEFLGQLALHIDEGAIVAPDHPFIVDAMAEACLRASRGGGDEGTRLLHTFDGPIASQLASHAEALGGAEEVVVVSPYFGGPEPLRDLALALGCGKLSVLVPGRSPEFFDFAAAARLGLEVEPIRSDTFSSTALLHAKIMEISCRRGRLVLSGSTNATRPALVTSNNVEVSVLRMVDDRLTFGWSATDARDVADGEGGESDPRGGACLTARFDGIVLTGRVLGHADPAGSWHARIVAGVTHTPIGSVTVEPDGRFGMRSTGTSIDRDALRATQLVLERDTAEVRGWLVFSHILGAVRERGPVAEAMIRTLAGAEDPDDLAVILSFFVSHPEAFLGDDVGMSVSRSTIGPSPDAADVTIDLALLEPTTAFANANDLVAPMSGTNAFERLLTSIRRYVREFVPSGTALPDAADTDETARGGAEKLDLLPRWRIEAVVDALAIFVGLLPRDGSDFRRHAVSLLDFILFAAEKTDEPDVLKADHVRRWLRVVRDTHAARDEPDVLDRAFVAVTASRVLADPPAAARMHARLQGWYGGLVEPAWADAVAPSADGIRERRLAGEAGADAWKEAMRRILSTRTTLMDIHDIQRALKKGGSMPPLPAALAAEAEVLKRVVDGKSRTQVLSLAIGNAKTVCPRCHMVLPVLAREQLREHRLVLTPCCHRVLLDPLPE